MTADLTCSIIFLTCEKGFSCRACFSLSRSDGEFFQKGREAIGIHPASAGHDTNNKEVPLNARESHTEMQRVQAEKLQYDEEQEEHSGQAGTEQVLPLLQKAHAPQRNQVTGERMMRKGV